MPGAYFLKLHERDNVLVALKDLKKGLSIAEKDLFFSLITDVPAKHKFALEERYIGDAIVMYGTLVGRAVKPIAKGELISTQNIEHAAMAYSVGQRKHRWDPPDVSRWEKTSFMGYHRADGSVGTANYWLIIPMVFCENRNVEVLRSALLKALGYQTNEDFSVATEALVSGYQNGASPEELLATDIIRTPEQIKAQRIFPNVDGIKFLTHNLGCGGMREDSDNLCQLLAGYITNPNVAGATVLSLGCQNAEVRLLEEAIHQRDPNFSKPFHVLEQQLSASERHFIEEAVKKTFLGLIEANKTKRKPAPLDQLVLGLECGGSDGFSGISANPVLGHTSDLLVALGATTVLAEFPELNGVEQELINRCTSAETAKKFADLMDTYAAKAIALGSGLEKNPSPGNIKDGLITDAMKSAGAAKKGGSSPVTDVLNYTEKISRKGLNLLCTPGNDVESTTGLAASGCNLIAFTTGLGTPTGNPVAPVIKIASNNELYHRMNDIIDFNTGTVISGEDSLTQKGEELLEYLIKVASGEVSPASVRLGQDDFIPWKRGISL